MMKRRERDLPADKNIIVVLFYEPSENEEQEKETANHPRPPYEPLSKDYCHLHNLEV